MPRALSIASIELPRRKVVSDVHLRLPMPPSKNRLWKAGRGRVYPSAEYEAWIKEAGWSLCEQRPGRIEGRYVLHLRIARADTKCDLGNHEVAISDLLQTHGVIKNDNLCEGITVYWDDTPDATGVMVMLVSARSGAAA